MKIEDQNLNHLKILKIMLPQDGLGAECKLGTGTYPISPILILTAAENWVSLADFPMCRWEHWNEWCCAELKAEVQLMCYVAKSWLGEVPV